MASGVEQDIKVRTVSLLFKIGWNSDVSYRRLRLQLLISSCDANDNDDRSLYKDNLYNTF